MSTWEAMNIHSYWAVYEESVLVALVPKIDRNDESARQLANQIAIMPDLLEACKLVQNTMAEHAPHYHEVKIDREAYDAICSAITKAESFGVDSSLYSDQ